MGFNIPLLHTSPQTNEPTPGLFLVLASPINPLQTEQNLSEKQELLSPSCWRGKLMLLQLL